MATIIEIDYFNSFLLKKVVKKTAAGGIYAMWPNILPAKLQSGVLEYKNYFPGDAATSSPAADELRQELNWYVEESRIRGGYNNTFTDYGVRAYLVEDEDQQERLKSSLIYSGIYNSRTGVNNTNQFSSAESITKSLNPLHGSIQKLYSENTNLTIFQENKSGYLLVDKDTIYTAEGGTQTQAARTVLGQYVPYLGEYGISKNPESFAVYGGRKYYADKNRNAILRLSRDGITEISKTGMFDYFRDELTTITDDFQRYVVETVSEVGTGTDIVITTNGDCIEYGMMIEQGGLAPTDLNATVVNIQYNTPIGKWTITASQSVTVTTSTNFVKYAKDTIKGGWDIHNRNYIVSSQQGVPENGEAVTCGGELPYKTLAFEEDVKGWTSFYSYNPAQIGSLKNKFYTFKDGALWEHYDENSNNTRGTFYNNPNNASITFLFNDNPTVSKNFNTIAYEGGNGWQVEYFKSDIEGVDYQYFPAVPGGWEENQDLTAHDFPPGPKEPDPLSISVLSHLQGRYETATPTNTGTDAVTPPFSYAGFNRKENRYVANLVNNSVVRPGEVIFGSSVSGVKGYYVEVKFSTDNLTQEGGMKELFSVSSNWVMSAT